ncbi:MAG: InlB B-repeat-containing protein, partial [Clostridia bacterium]|nr:InlB B-repeat-containing protein [Clostridia bacterium]
EEKTFSGVELSEGKTMTSEWADDMEVPETQLYILENEEISAEVLTDGREREVVIISFDTGEGEAVRDMSVPKGAASGARPDASMDGYKFLGWYTDPALTTPFDSAAPLSESLTLYAKYGEAYDVFAGFSSVNYDGSAVTATMEYDYNRTGSKMFAALYQNGQMISAGLAEVTSDDTVTTVKLPASGLYGVYQLKVFALDDKGRFTPINSGVETSFFAD